jgi:hypothetical protein
MAQETELEQEDEVSMEDFQKLVQAIDLLCGKVEAMDKMYDAMNTHVDLIDKTLNEDLIGGLKGLYEDNEKEEGIKSLKEKYGEQLAPYDEALKAFNPDHDTFGSIYSSLKGLKAMPGYTDEMGDKHVQDILDGLGERFGKMSGALSKAKPIAAKVEVTKEAIPEEDGEEPAQSELEKMAARMSKKSKF